MTRIPEFILALITTLSFRTFRFSVNREKLFSHDAITEISNSASKALKVVETPFWAKIDPNTQVYDINSSYTLITTSLY